MLFRDLASLCEFGKDRLPDNIFDLPTVFCVHQRDHLPASLCGSQDPDTLGTGDEFFLFHHGKVREDVVMGDIQKLRETPGSGEFYADGVPGEGDADRSFLHLNPDRCIKERIDRECDHMKSYIGIGCRSIKMMKWVLGC